MNAPTPFIVTPAAIAAVLVHVDEVAAGLDWYARALPGSQRVALASSGAPTALELGGVRVELVPADGKVSSGAAGTVVYWRVSSFGRALDHLLACGATLYRGPMEIEYGQTMCQVRDPWGNCIGLLGPR